jgi:tRNA nucleotidyltransferase/poly(A) polymerase
MSKKGPLQNPPRTHIKIEDLLRNPQQYTGLFGSELISSLNNTFAILASAKEFVNVTMVQEPAKRQARLLEFFTSHPDLLAQSFIKLIEQIDHVHASQPCDFARLEAEIAEIEEQKNNLTISEEIAIKEVRKQLKEKKTNKLNLLLSQLMQGCGNINCWYELLKLADNPDIQKKLLLKTVSEINLILAHIERLFIQGKIPRDNYFIYHLLFEKYTWFYKLLDKYQAQLIEEFSTDPDSLGATLSTAQNSIVFQSAFCHTAAAQQLFAKSLAFCEKIEPLLSEESKTIVNRFKTLSGKLDEIHDAVMTHQWLPTFNLIEAYIQADETPTITTYDIIAIEKNIQKLQALLPIDSAVRCDPELLKTCINELIGVLNEERYVCEKLNPNIYKQLYRIALTLSQLAELEPSFKKNYIGLCIPGAMFKLTEKMKELCVKSLKAAQTAQPVIIESAVSDPLVDTQLVTSPILIEEPKELIATEVLEAPQIETTTSVIAQSDIASLNQRLAQLKLEETNEESALEEEWQKRRLQMHSSLQQSHQEALKIALADKKLRFAEKQDALRTQHAKAKEALKERLIAKEHDSLRELEKKHQIEWEALQLKLDSQLKKYSEKKEKQYQRKLQALEEAHAAKISELQSKHLTQMALLLSQHQKILTSLEQSKVHHFSELRAVNAETLREREKNLQATAARLSQTIHPATAGHTSIGTIPVPIEIAYIMQDLADAGIEAYLVGGFVRDHLLGVNRSSKADFDIIINALPSQLPTKLKRFAKQNPFKNSHYKMGNIDFWCQPWNNLQDELKKRDFTLNTFICDLNGNAYDLCGYQAHIEDRYLHFIRDIELQVKEDSSLILRALRFSTQLSKQIHQNDLKKILVMAPLITDCPFGVYLKNIEHLFTRVDAVSHFHNLNAVSLLPFIFPNLYVSHANPALDAFIRYKLEQFSNSTKEVDYYQILTLFTLPSVLGKPIPSENDLRIQISSCLNHFFSGYKGLLTDAEKSKTLQSVLALFLNAKTQKNETILGLYNEFLQYEDSFKRFQLLASSPQLVPAYHHYQAQIPVHEVPVIAPVANSFKPN